MSVLILFSSSQIGGAEKSLTRMAISANNEKFYTLATLDGRGPWVEWCRKEGLEPLVYGGELYNIKHGRFGIATICRLIIDVRHKKYSVIYVIGLRASLILRIILPLLGRIKLVHGIRWNPNSNSSLDRTLRTSEKLLGWLVSLYICNSNAAANTLRTAVGVSDQKIEVIYNGISDIPDKIIGSKSMVSILTVANLNPRKGHLEYLANVVKYLCGWDPTLLFVFAGRDDMNGNVQKRSYELKLSNNVSYSGFSSNIEQELKRCSIFVLPSLRGEGCPTSILEAMAYGLPVVAFAIDGIPELVEDGVDGYLIPPGDYKSMVTAIKKILCDRELALRLGEAGRKKVNQRFTVELCSRFHRKVLNDLV